MALEKFDFDSEEGDCRDMMGPGALDQQLRQCVQFCWMCLPKSRRSIDDVEKEIRFLVDRMFKDLREDEKRRRDA